MGLKLNCIITVIKGIKQWKYFNNWWKFVKIGINCWRNGTVWFLCSGSNPSTLFISLWEWEMKWSWWNCCFAAGSVIWKSLIFNEAGAGEQAILLLFFSINSQIWRIDEEKRRMSEWAPPINLSINTNQTFKLKKFNLIVFVCWWLIKFDWICCSLLNWFHQLIYWNNKRN